MAKQPTSRPNSAALSDTAAPDVKSDAPSELERGTYEIIRNRLRSQGEELRQRMARLNEARREVFGAIPTQLLATERITTEHNCKPRDIVPVGKHFILGYNVHLGLKNVTELADVFAVYKFSDLTFQERPLDLISAQAFRTDFQQVYKYYREAQFSRFYEAPPYLYFLFQTGKSVRDIKAFKWLVRDGALEYVDGRSEHDIHLPAQHDFTWTRTHRDLHRSGKHPHISIDDAIFVEAVGGDLTIKIEDNTDDGIGIYREPVDDPDQTLDDAEFFYALVGNIILLKMRPFRELAFRYLAYNRKTQTVQRIDSIGQACVMLPEDHGLIFTNGYYLQSGEFRTFESSLTDLQFERRLPAANGEDHLYVFYSQSTGQYVLLSYNMIQLQVQPPVQCHGYSFFDNGQLVVFRTENQPQKHHALQIWQTPFVADGMNTTVKTDSMLYKIGNRDIVRGMAECQEILTLISKDDAYADLYIDLVKKTGVTLDAWYWLGDPAAMNLAETLKQIRDSAKSAVDEFEKVVRIRANTRDQFAATKKQTEEAISQSGRRRYEVIDDYVASLSDLRKSRGQLISVRELKYIDLAAVDTLEKSVIEASDRLSHKCIEFLARDAALDPYQKRVDTQRSSIEAVKTVTESKKLDEALAAGATELEMLIEIVSNLRIDDATQRTRIIDNVSAIYSSINQTRAVLKKRTRELMTTEGAAEFSAQLKLLNQAVINYIDVCDTPEKCDEYLTKLMVQVEELEGRFAEFDEYVAQLVEKREEIHSAFDSRKMQIVEGRNRRASALMNAAERILTGVKTRVAGFKSTDEINSYFAADLMIGKVRDIIGELDGLDESVKVDDLQSRLKTIREDTVRQLRDKQEIYVEGQNVIRLGKHQFSVNVQPLDLTTLVKDDRLSFHLTGTKFTEPLDSPELDKLRDVWDQELISENRTVYRSEYLAWTIFNAQRQGSGSISRSLRSEFVPDPFPSANPIHRPVSDAFSPANTKAENQGTDRKKGSDPLPSTDLNSPDPESLLACVREFMAPRYSEGYIKGVHDHDAALILGTLLQMDQSLGLLKFDPLTRGMVLMFRHSQPFQSDCQGVAEQVRWVVQAQNIFGHVSGRERLEQRLAMGVQDFQGKLGLGLKFDTALAARMLFEEIANEGSHASRAALELAKKFLATLDQNGHRADFDSVMQHAVMQTRFEIAFDWLKSFTQNEKQDAGSYLANPLLFETAAVFASGKPIDQIAPLDGSAIQPIEGLLGDHPILHRGIGFQPESGIGFQPVIAPGADQPNPGLGTDLPTPPSAQSQPAYHLDFIEFRTRLSDYIANQIPRYQKFVETKKSITTKRREELKLEEFKPRVLSSFVRNKLINDVYLPIVGDNLAKQIGTTGENKRTDLMGLLLLISPPGYGKTTLMEYIGSRLGLTFVKVNGPAIGHQVTSLDPDEAPNASAREEVEKLNLALEMGDNVMIYLDDIQHCNPEFLQKFISLCDATRRIEGVFRGRSRTYDLRGRKVCVVMAGNPYTESGEKFQIPDMLANRADTYNLGDVIGESQDSFELSYIENALTSNSTLQRLNSGSRQDILALIAMATSESSERKSLDGNYTSEEINEMLGVLRKMIRIRAVVLKINRNYIDSAAQADAYRTEPPFRLQGSYRDMNKMAERVLPIMNDAELEQLIVDHYINQAQTLTTGAEANLLKFRELLGKMSPADRDRWEDIKRTFKRNLVLGSAGSDNVAGQVIAQIATLGDALHDIRKAVDHGMTAMRDQTEAATNDPLRQTTLAHVGTAVEQLIQTNAALDQIRTALGSLSEATQQRAESPTPIEVKNSVPPVFLEIIRYQFQTLEQWLNPLTKLAESLPAAKDVSRTAKKVAKNYKKIIEHLEKDAGSVEEPDE